MTSRNEEPTDELLAHIAWSRLTEPGDMTASKLVRTLGAIRAFDWLSTSTAPAPPGVAPDPRWAQTSANWRARLHHLDPRREYEVIRRLGGVVLTNADPLWPPAMNDLGDRAPICLWVRGDPGVLTSPGVGIVGARACTRYGERVAHDLAEGAAGGNLVVISGGAFGIDAAAHRSALAAGGTTVAFQAGGVDRFYPVAHNELLTQMTHEGGAVVSEAPPGSAPMRQRFLMRNRLIAALGRAVIVVEASWRSGALSTARHAADLMRPLGAVPGPVTSMASAGCHRIIREGMAVCVTDADEMLELTGPVGAGPDPQSAQEGILDGLDPDAARVLDAFPARSGTTVDALVHVAGLAPEAVLRAIGSLQLAGRIARAGGKWKRTI